jgi:hypothetical protein
MKISKRTVLTWIIMGCCWFGSCVQFTPATLDKFQKGMTIAQTLDITPMSPRHEFTISLPSDASAKLLVHTYILSIGEYKSDYFLAFRNDKLVYWGYPHEFARSSDPYLNEIGKVAVEEYKKIK